MQYPKISMKYGSLTSVVRFVSDKARWPSGTCPGEGVQCTGWLRVGNGTNYQLGVIHPRPIIPTFVWIPCKDVIDIIDPTDYMSWRRDQERTGQWPIED